MKTTRYNHLTQGVDVTESLTDYEKSCRAKDDIDRITALNGLYLTQESEDEANPGEAESVAKSAGWIAFGLVIVAFLVIWGAVELIKG